METKHLLSRISFRLRMAKAGRGLALEKVGRIIGRSASAVSRSIDNPGGMTLRRFFDLCETFEVDPGEILTLAIEDARMGRGALP